MKTYKAKYNLYKSENKEVVMDLECEKKLLNIMSTVMDNDPESKTQHQPSKGQGLGVCKSLYSKDCQGM